MKKRNPIFVAAITTIPSAVGYTILNLMSVITDNSDNKRTVLLGTILFLIGTVYGLYWLIDTAKTLRQTATETKIPSSIFLVIPLANFWWLWQYSKSAEVYTNKKGSAMLNFILLALLGGIGMAILQDIYNKMTVDTSHTPPALPKIPN